VKILILGRLDGWMGVHMQQYANGFRQNGHDVQLIDYHIYCQKKFIIKSIFGDKKQAQINERTHQFKQVLKEVRPDVVIFTGANLKFNFDELKVITPAKLIYVDMDGPAASYFNGDVGWIDSLDIVATVSRVSQRDLNSQGYEQVIYLPHGVDVDYYRPLQLSGVQRERFASPLAFVGKPSERRVEYLSPLINQGLTVWGGRWSNPEYKMFQGCVKESQNIIGSELNELYNASDVVLNILQRDAFSEKNTMLSLQVFAVPASGSCLVTEWVEELDAEFDVGEEVLAYKSVDELERVCGVLQDTKYRHKLKRKCRQRCLAQHSHLDRAKTLLTFCGF
jgi:hypothetical protein